MDTGLTSLDILSTPAALSRYGLEPLESSGIVPDHQKRAVTARIPLLEILQRLVYRLQPGTNLEVVLALIALYQAGFPVYHYVKRVLQDVFTSQITVSEHDPVAKEILAYMTANVMPQGRTTKAMLVSVVNFHDGSDSLMRDILHHRSPQAGGPDELQYMPPLGKKLFW
jgi:mitochondrial chaperone BCS1